MKKLRIALFILVAEIHALVILSVDFNMPPIEREEEPLRVMKLVDLADYVPPSPNPEASAPRSGSLSPRPELPAPEPSPELPIPGSEAPLPEPEPPAPLPPSPEPLLPNPEPPSPKPEPPLPEPPEPPAPPEPRPVIPEEILPDIVVEPIAERMIEIDQEPVGQTLAEPGSIVNTMPLPEAVIIVNTTPPEDDDPLNTTPLPGEDDTPNTRPPPASGSAVETVSLPEAGGWEEEYLPADRISDMPVFPEAEILAALVYPPAAKRAGIEGRVILALFIHQTGEIRRIDLLSEEPAGRGFGEAARKAFQGIVCEPAKANGQAVSSRIRYPLSFRLR